MSKNCPAAPWEYESTTQTMKRSDLEMRRIVEVKHGMTIRWTEQSLAEPGSLVRSREELWAAQSDFLALKALGIARNDKRDPCHRRTTAVPVWEGMQQKGSIELLAYIYIYSYSWYIMSLLYSVYSNTAVRRCWIRAFKGAHLIILLNSVSVHVPVSIHRTVVSAGLLLNPFLPGLIMNWWPQCNPQTEFFNVVN